MEEMLVKNNQYFGNQLSFAQERLEKNNIKVTLGRRKILELFIKKADKHFSPKEVFQYFYDVNMNLGLATIYRTLNLFEALNIISKLILQDGIVKYGLNKMECSKDTLHIHLICANCGEIIDYEDEEVEKVFDKIKDHIDFEIQSIEVEFYGYCKNCKSKSMKGECAL